MGAAEPVVKWAFWLLYAPLAVCLAYLLLLTIASYRTPLTTKTLGPGEARFAILVPAHNEEPVVGALLASLRQLDYPASRYSVFVAADHCTDATAAVARAGGARVFERAGPGDRGKGAALQWLLEQVTSLHEPFDAFVILDADTRVCPAFLRAMEVELGRGFQALQGYDGVLNPEAGVGAALRHAAMTLINVVRPLGKNALGLATGLKGNGMCFAADVLRALGWSAHSLAEDAEYGVRLLLSGVRPRFVPSARVWAQMPPGVRQGESQNRRWEAGRLRVFRHFALLLIQEFLRRRDIALLDAALELAVPPLSVLAAGTVLLLGASFVLPGLTEVRWAAAMAAGALAVHVVGGLARAGAPPAVWRALLYAPGYCAWKLALYLPVVLGHTPSAWVRTRRFP